MGYGNTYEVTEDIQELNEVPDHWSLDCALRIVQHHVSATESSGLMNVLKGRMGRLRLRRSRKGGGARTDSLSPFVCLPLIYIVAEVRRRRVLVES